MNVPGNSNGSSNNLPFYPPDSRQSQNAVYKSMGKGRKQLQIDTDLLLTITRTGNKLFKVLTLIIILNDHKIQKRNLS